MDKLSAHLKRGIITDNPIFVQVLGMCPTLAVSTSAINGLGMGLSVVVVLMGSNLVISLLRKFIPNQTRIPGYIVVIAAFVTIIDLLLQAFFYDTLYQSLGLYVPLIVVNCIILGRAESYASKHTPGDSLLDGFSQGIGFTLALTLLGAIREIIGGGTIFGIQLIPSSFQPATFFLMAPGGFIVLGILLAVFNALKNRKPADVKERSEAAA